MCRCMKAANALTVDEIQGLSYLQVKGSGLANACPSLAQGSSDLKSIKAGTYTLENMCIEPTAIQVKEESQFKAGETGFVDTKFLTRLTYTLEGVSQRLIAVACSASITNGFPFIPSRLC